MNAVLNRDPAARNALASFLSAYNAYTNHGILPELGGWADQTAQFEQSVNVADAERGRWEALRERHLESERKKAERKAKAGAGKHARK